MNDSNTPAHDDDDDRDRRAPDVDAEGQAMRPRRPILSLRDAPRRTSADTAAPAPAASPGTAPARPAFGWVPAPVTWRERMAAEVEALTGGRPPAVLGAVRSGGPWMPFTVGIRGAFLAAYPEADVDRVRRLFARLCASDGYLRALAREGARRHDLDGIPLGPVSDAHRARAAQQIEARRAKGAKGGKA